MGVRKWYGSVWLCVGVLLYASPVFAGGYYIPHQTARGVGMSNALTAGVDDPSAVYYNPSALSEIDGNRLLLSGTYINVVSSVENSGHKDVNGGRDNFAGSFFGNYHVPGTDLHLGLGVYSPFGLATSYHAGFTRFAARDAELKTYYLTPALAWSPSQYFSVGAGASYIHATGLFSRTLCFDPVLGCTNRALVAAEERIRLHDDDDTYSYNIGLLVKPTDRLKIGFSYRATADLHFDRARAKLKGDFGPAHTIGDVRPIPLPAIINVGLFYKITPDWGAEIVYERQNWSRFRDLSVNFPNPPFGIPSLRLPRKWNDTNTVRMGSYYRLDKHWELRGGIGLEQGPIPDKTLNPSIPGGDVLTLNGGVGYDCEHFSLGFGYQAIFYKTRNVKNKELEGAVPPGLPFAGAPGKDKYKTFNNFLTVSAGYRF